MIVVRMPRPMGSRNSSLEIREAAMRMLDKGMPQTKVADILGRSQGIISLWHKAYKKNGKTGLERKPVSGRPRKLNDRDLRKLLFYLAKGATAYGFRNDVWTLKRIADVIRREFGVNYHPGHVWKLLIRLGLSHQKPERRALERDDKEIARWKKQVWPKIRKKSNGQNTTLVTLDESGRSETPTVIATWAPKGQPPILKHHFNWDRCSIISGITPRGNLHYRLHYGTIKKEHVVSFLKHLLRWIPGRIIVLWDGGPIHKARIVNEFIQKNTTRLEVHRFPPYAPEINPDEHVYHRLKYVETPNTCLPDLPNLMRDTRRAMENIRRRPGIIQGFFRESGLAPGLTFGGI